MAIDINSEADLKKIGNDAGFPLSGAYVLNASFIISDEWIAIGSMSSPFTGTFNGYNGTAKNTITFQSSTPGGVFTLKQSPTEPNPNSAGFGLFGYVRDSEIKNLTIFVESDMTSDVNTGMNLGIGPLVSVLVGRAAGDLTIEDCHIKTAATTTPTLFGDVHVGSFVGSADVPGSTTPFDLKIIDSTSSINIDGLTSVGGFVGDSADGKINAENCEYTGNVVGRAAVGGFIGYAQIDADLKNISTHGSVSSIDESIAGFTNGEFAGGIAGRIGNPSLSPILISIQNSFSTSDILADANYAGGLAGQIASATIKQSYATGNVTALGTSGITGGLVGQINTDTQITESYATGNVHGRNSGGFVGFINFDAIISDCYSTGNILSDTAHAGGFIGFIQDGGTISVKNCYSTGTVKALGNYSYYDPDPDYGYVGGFIGKVNSSKDTSRVSTSLSLTDCMALANQVNSQAPSSANAPSGKFLGGVLIDGLVNKTVINMDVTIADSYYWVGTYGGNTYTAPVDIPGITNFNIDFNPVSKDNVWFTLGSDPIWTTWNTAAVWEQAPVSSGYGLPILGWQNDSGTIVAPIPDGTGLFYTPSSGGSSTGGATISSNGSSPAPTGSQNPPVDTTSPVQNNNTQPLNNATPPVSGSTDERKPISTTTWLIIGCVLIIVAVACVFGYRYYNDKKV